MAPGRLVTYRALSKATTPNAMNTLATPKLKVGVANENQEGGHGQDAGDQGQPEDEAEGLAKSRFIDKRWSRLMRLAPVRVL